MRTHSPGFKAKAALAALKSDKTLAESAKLFDVHPHQIAVWKAQLQEGAAGVCGAGTAAAEATPTVDLKLLHAKIGKLTQEKKFCPVRSCRSRLAERKTMIDRAHGRPVVKQAGFMRLSRSNVYDLPSPVPPARLALMHGGVRA